MRQDDTATGELATTTDAPPRAGWVLAALLCAAVVCNLNTVAAGIAVPAIGAQFDASQTSLNLVALATGLGLSISVLYLGALADRYGRKQMLLLGVAGTVAAGVLSSLSWSVEALIGAQVFVGLASGMAFPTTLSLISALWAAGPRRTGVIALWSSVSSMASIAGSILAGALLTFASWPWVFVLSVPIAVVAFVLVLLFVPGHVGESSDPVDHFGGVLSAAGLGCLVLGMSIVFAPGGALRGGILLILSVVLLAVFGWRQARARFPLFDLRVARQRLFWLPAVGGLIAVGTLSGTLFVGEQFMQSVMGYDPLQAGVAVVPAVVSLLLAAPLSARAVAALGTRSTMLIGYGFLLAAMVSMLLWREHSPYPLVGFSFFVIGVGVTFVMTASRRALTGSTPVRRAGMASATSDLQSDLGGAIMQALLGAVLASGFTAAVSAKLSASPDAASLSEQVTHALQSSFASAVHVAEQFPRYTTEILDGARASLLDGSLIAFLIGTGVILAGALAVRIGLPGRDEERRLTTTG
ncbi:MFS transporter [Microbacterium sp.]|uniref:MFS transporter n=1 Tax=Microbacterium sp. TaxID=51671 RepID=UPI0039E63AFB